MSYQVYVLHLIDGTTIQMAEDYDLPVEKESWASSPRRRRTMF